jgi:uncharacterized protein YoxC
MKIITTEEEKKFLNLEQEESNIKKRIGVLNREFNDTNAKLAKVKEDFMNTELESKKLIDDAKEKAKELTDLAQEKVAKADVILGGVNGKVAELDRLTKEAGDLKQSNDGRAINLSAAEKCNEALKIKLANISKRIKEMLEE